MNGRVVSIYNGVAEAGRYNVVSISLGKRDGIEIGHVLSLHRNRGETLYREDNVGQSPAVPAAGAALRPGLRVPVFDRIAYALVMDNDGPRGRVATASANPDAPIQSRAADPLAGGCRWRCRPVGSDTLIPPHPRILIPCRVAAADLVRRVSAPGVQRQLSPPSVPRKHLRRRTFGAGCCGRQPIARTVLEHDTSGGRRWGLAWADEPSNNVITLGDPLYPQRCSKSPIRRCCSTSRASGLLSTAQSIAVVGARNATPQGEANAEPSPRPVPGWAGHRQRARAGHRRRRPPGRAGQAGQHRRGDRHRRRPHLPGAQRDLARRIAEAGAIISEFPSAPRRWPTTSPPQPVDRRARRRACWWSRRP